MKLCSTVANVKQIESSWDGPVEVIHSDGSTIDVELNVSVVPCGRNRAALVFVRDVSEAEAWKHSI